MSPELPKAAWDTLLGALDSEDRERAGQAYLELQDRLIRFFEWRQAAMPEELAFETLRRLALKLHDGVELTSSVKAFALGFARRVLQEHWRKPVEAELSPGDVDKDQDAALAQDADIEAKERLARCLDLCAEGDPDGYDLLLRFHQFDGRDRINQRKKLAEDLGKSVNALRIEACRRRKELRRRLDQCLDGIRADEISGVFP